MKIRYAEMADLDLLTAIEEACFPAAEAASRNQFEDRLRYFPAHFWLLENDEGKVISFINGAVSREPLIRDEMFADASCHEEDGEWQMIFGVNTLPAYRKQGMAGMVMRQVIEDSRKRGYKGLVLTCKEEKIHFYSQFGYELEGVSESEHGGARWYDMRLKF